MPALSPRPGTEYWELLARLSTPPATGFDPLDGRAAAGAATAGGSAMAGPDEGGAEDGGDAHWPPPANFAALVALLERLAPDVRRLVAAEAVEVLCAETPPGLPWPAWFDAGAAAAAVAVPRVLAFARHGEWAACPPALRHEVLALARAADDGLFDRWASVDLRDAQRSAAYQREARPLAGLLMAREVLPAAVAQASRAALVVYKAATHALPLPLAVEANVAYHAALAALTASQDEQQLILAWREPARESEPWLAGGAWPAELQDVRERLGATRAEFYRGWWQRCRRRLAFADVAQAEFAA